MKIKSTAALAFIILLFSNFKNYAQQDSILIENWESIFSDISPLSNTGFLLDKITLDSAYLSMNGQSNEVSYIDPLSFNHLIRMIKLAEVNNSYAELDSIIPRFEQDIISQKEVPIIITHIFYERLKSNTDSLLYFNESSQTLKLSDSSNIDIFDIEELFLVIDILK